MKAILLSAGFGSRLYPITETKPKCLLDIDGEPILGRWLRELDIPAINEIFINTHHLSNQVKDYIQKMELCSKITISHEKVLLGTGKTLKKIAHDSEHDFLVVHTDNYIECAIADFINFHQKRKRKRKDAVITVMTFDTDKPKSCGIFEFDDSGKVIGFYEKSEEFHGNVANGAVYIFSSKILKLIQGDNEDYDIARDIIPRYLNYVETWHNSGVHIDIGTFEGLAKARLAATKKNRIL